MMKFDQEENIFIVKLFGRTCHIIPKDKLFLMADQQSESYQQITLLIQTVEENKKLCTERESRNAALARQAQMRLGYPSTADIIEGINNGRIMNLPITRADFNSNKDLGQRL